MEAVLDLDEERVEHEAGVADQGVSARTSFERSAGSSVEWMMRFPFGIFTP